MLKPYKMNPITLWCNERDWLVVQFAIFMIIIYPAAWAMSKQSAAIAKVLQ